MNRLIFFDTNVIVYAHDARELGKQQQARQLLKKHTTAGTAVVSSQVVQEFCQAMLRKQGMTSNDLELILNELLLPMMRHTPNDLFYRQALQLFSTESISYYDALIVQAALELGCTTLYSEDLQDGRRYGSLTVVNPFKSAVDVGQS